MRLQRALVIGLVVALAGCGGSAETGDAPSGADPAQALPTGAAMYVEAVVRPEGEQGDNAEALLDRFLGDRELSDILDEQLQDEGRTYAEDIEPWLGARIGFTATNLYADEPEFAGAIEVTDRDAAQTALTEGPDALQSTGTYEGAQLLSDADDDDMYGALTDDYLLLASTEAGVKQEVDALEGESLADDQKFNDAMGDLPGERLGAFYLDIAAFKELAKADPTLDPAGAAVIDQILPDDAAPVTVALTAEDDALLFESNVDTSSFGAFGALAGGEAPELVADAPAGTWAVIGYRDVGNTLKTVFEQFAGAVGGAAIAGQLESQTGINLDRDIYSWVGDLSVWVRGESLADLDGALVIQATDDAAAKAALPKIIAAARRDSAPVREASIDGAEQAYTVPFPEAPGPLVLAYGNERMVLSVGEEAAAESIEPSETISDDGLYARAEEAIDGIPPALILDIGTALALAEASGATDDPEYQEVKPYFEQLDLMTSGTEEDDDHLRSLFSIKLTDE